LLVVAVMVLAKRDRPIPSLLRPGLPVSFSRFLFQHTQIRFERNYGQGEGSHCWHRVGTHKNPLGSIHRLSLLFQRRDLLRKDHPGKVSAKNPPRQQPHSPGCAYQPFVVLLVDPLTFVGSLGLFSGQQSSLYLSWDRLDFELNSRKHSSRYTLSTGSRTGTHPQRVSSGIA
jgi:hypothetical protein